MEFTEKSAAITKEVAKVLSRVEPHQVENLVQAIMQTSSLYLDGRGRSGLMMRAFAIRLTHLDIHCHVVGESTTPALQKGDLLLVGSGSGETITPLLAAKSAKARSGKICVLTARQKSSLAGMADILIVVPAPVRETSDIEPVTTAQPMGSLFEQSLLLLLDTIVMMLKERLQRDERMMMARHSNLE